MLKTKQTVLRIPISEDKARLIAMRNDVELQSMLMARARPNSENKIDEWLSKRLSDDRGVFFAIADVNTNHLVGYLQLINIDFNDRRGELGICVDTESQGKGYARDAMSLLETYVKSVFGIRKITLQVLTNNERAIQFYQKSGYQSVGIFKEHFYLNDSFLDVLLMEKMI